MTHSEYENNSPTDEHKQIKREETMGASAIVVEDKQVWIDPCSVEVALGCVVWPLKENENERVPCSRPLEFAMNREAVAAGFLLNS